MDGSITFRIARSRAEVFAYVSDLERAPEWVPDLISVTKTTPGDVRLGTRYRQVVRVAGKQGDAELEVTEYEPGRSFAHRGEGGPARFTARFVFEDDEQGGTRIVHDYSVAMSGFAKLMLPVLKAWLSENTETAASNLALRLEQAAAAPREETGS